MKLSVMLAGLCLAAPPIAADAQAQQQIAGIYSDLRYIPEAGDLLGTEIFIVPSANGTAYVAFVQEADGDIANPVIAPVTRQGGRVSIRVPMDGYTMEFNGAVGAKSFDGTLTTQSQDGKKSSEPFHLRRKKSYWEGP
jgi:hypothetical protein